MNRRVVLPLIRPAFLTGLIYSFARSMTAISAIIFLVTPQTRIMTQQILNENQATKERHDLWEKQIAEERQSLDAVNAWQRSIRLTPTSYTRP
jgi:ABC-type molybdate transport system permease subunit